MTKILAVILSIVALTFWVGYSAVLLEIYNPQWLPEQFQALEKPETTAEFGDSFAVIEGLITSFALVTGLLAVFIQARQSSQTNIIGALTARHSYLLSECSRLEDDIQQEKRKPEAVRDWDLIKGMAGKKSRFKKDADDIDGKIQHLLSKF